MPQLREQRQPVAPEIRIVAVDHHVIEEPVDGRAQSSEPRERRAVIPLRQGAIHVRDNAGERFV